MVLLPVQRGAEEFLPLPLHGAQQLVERLRKELRTRDLALADALQPLCISLAEVYFSTRYPGFDLEDPDWPDVRRK